MQRFTLLLVLCLLLSGCHVGRFLLYNFSDIRDYKKFPAVLMEAPETAFAFTKVATPDTARVKLPRKATHDGKEYDFETFLEKKKTVAFIIIRNDSIFYEQYFNGYDEYATVTSFSVAKSVVSCLVGIAVAEGKISQVDDPITKYVPQLRGQEGFDQITVEHVLDMRSGIKFNESYYSPFSDAAKYYYGTNLKKYIAKMEVERAPGERFEYRSGNTVLLSIALEEATGMPLEQYAEQKLWKRIGAERPASWSLDSKKHHTVKGFAGLNGIARDFARFGRLYLNNGNWNGEQIVPADWVRRSGSPVRDGEFMNYSYQWWHTPEYEWKEEGKSYPSPFKVKKVTAGENAGREYVEYPPDSYTARGHLGQFIFIHPEKNVIILRFGKKDKDVNWVDGIFRPVAELL